MKILHSADWHIDRSNLEFTVPAIEAGIDNSPDYDLFVHAGDLCVHRGHVHPEVAYQVRRLVQKAARRARHGALVIAGNHDTSFQANLAGMATGILASEERRGDPDKRIEVVEDARWISLGDVAFVCVPTPSKYAVAQMIENNPGIEADAVLEQMIQGMILSARDKGYKTIIGVYHGTVHGAQLGNEQIMRAGVDVSVGQTAFRGCERVLAGHIHHPQQIGTQAGGGTPILYPGCPAPLTFADEALCPRFLLHDLDDGLVTVVPLPVLSQMLTREVNFGDSAEDLDLKTCLTATLAGIEAGARVRLKVRGPRAILQGIKPVDIEAIKTDLELRSLKLVTEITDLATAKVSVGDDWSLAETFASWCRMRGTAPDLSESALEYLLEIEAGIADKHLDARYECKPVSIEATNWCQFGDVRIDFSELGKVVAIVGDDNYIGKSNLSRLFAFARYRKQISGDNMGDLIRHGEQKATVTEVFEHDGHTYQITRTLKRSGKSARAELLFCRLEDGSWGVMNEETARETQAAIERLIGPWELFRATTYAGQNDVDGLLDLTGAELKDTLTEVLQRDFESRQKIAAAKVLTAEDTAKTLAASIEIGERATAAIPDLKSRVSEIETALAGKRAELLVIPADEGLVREVAAAEHELEQIASRTQEIADLRADGRKAMDECDTLTSAIKAAEQIIARADRYPPEVMDGLPTESQLGTLREDLGKTEALVQIDREKARAFGDSRPPADGLRELEKRRDGLKSDLHLAEQGAAIRQRTAERLDEVPCRGGKWSRLDTGGRPNNIGAETVTVDMGACPLIADAKAAKEGAEKDAEDIERLTAAYLTAQGEHAAAAETYAKEVQEYDLNRQEASDALEKAESTLRRMKLDLEQKEADGRERVRGQQALDAAGQARIDRDARQEALDSTTARAQAARDKITTLEQSCESGAASDRLEAAQAALTAGRNQRERVEREARTLETDAAETAGRLKTLTEQQETVDGLRVELAESEKMTAALRLVHQSYHRDGIPYLLLEQYAIPQLQATTNAYLDNTDLRITVEGEKELTSGELRNDVVITFTDHRGTHPLSAASGMQRTAIGMALRNALADLHAQATGSQIWLSIQDEGFSTMVEKHLDGAKATIQQIAEQRGWFLFISHVAGMSDIADSLITVIDDGGVSRVVVA